MIVAGIDAGSRTIKVVLLDTEGLEVIGSGVVDQGVEQDTLARQLLDNVLEQRWLGPHRCYDVCYKMKTRTLLGDAYPNLR